MTVKTQQQQLRVRWRKRPAGAPAVSSTSCPASRSSGNADYPQDLYLAHGAEQVGEPEVDETAEVRSVPVDETPAMIANGDILGAITIVAVQHVLLRRAGVHVPPP